MPNDWNIGLAGQQGQPGVPGPAGGVFTDAPSDGFNYGRVNGAWGRDVPLTGGTMTGQLTVSFANSQIVLNKTASGQAASLFGMTNNLGRWAMQVGNGTGESGSNVGSDFAIYRYTDAGALIDGPLTITRSNGWTNISVVNTTSFQNNPTFAGSIVVNGNTTLQNVWINGAIETSFTCAGNVTINGGLNTYQQCYITGNYISTPGIMYSQLQNGVNWMGFAWGAPYAYVYVDGGSQYPMASASDERLKENITPSTYDCLTSVAQMPLHQYSWKQNVGRSKTRPTKAMVDIVPVGLIAQRVHVVVPSCVTAGDTGTIEEGTAEDPAQIWNIDTNNTLALLAGAIQQLLKRVEALEAKLP